MKRLIKVAPLLLSMIVVGLCFCGYQIAQDLMPKPVPPVQQETTAPTTAVTTAPTTTAAETVQTTVQTQPTEPQPKTFTTVDEAYFDDALFLGNSRIRLLGEYTPLGKATYYGVDCLSVFDAFEDETGAGGFDNAYEALVSRSFGKVYLAFGINECGYDTDSFIEHYQQIIDTVRTYQPNAVIYVQDIMYTTRAKTEDSGMFATKYLDEKNERIAQLADDKTIFYLHINEIVDDGTGYMRSELSGDGVHLYANEYHIWSDYLKTHAIQTSGT